MPAFFKRTLRPTLWRPLALAAALALPILTTPVMLVPAQAQAVQNPNTAFVQRQGSTMKITDALHYAANAGAYADRIQLGGYDGVYDCSIDGRNARMTITTEIFHDNALQSCFAGAPDCNFRADRTQVNIRFADFGWNNNPNAASVGLRLVSWGLSSGQGTLRVTHPNSAQPWELRVTATEFIAPHTDPRLDRIGPFRFRDLVTTMSGHTVWEGRRFPLSCTRSGMQGLRNLVLTRWAP